MNNFPWRLLTLLLLIHTDLTAQKLKKSDRVIVANIRNHLKGLGSEETSGQNRDSTAERLAADYVSRHFARSGLKPQGDTNTWYQQFEIYEGKQVGAATRLVINGQKLKLNEDYFPLPFSAGKSAEAAVAIALAENGVPWFKDLKEIFDADDSSVTDSMAIIREKAIKAADKGATALILYNSSASGDLVFDKMDSSAEVGIPVLYLTRNAFKKYCSEESDILDISLNVALETKKRKGKNIIGYADNNADSTIIAGARLNDGTDVAALLEIARLLRMQKKQSNYLFIAYGSEQKGLPGIDYFRQHPSIDLSAVNYAIDLDTVSVVSENPKGLHLVKRSIELIRNH